MTDFSHKGYLELLKNIKASGRPLKSFDHAAGYEGPHVILRHDVDFSLRKALEMAQLDHAAGATSTFFILLTAPYYNPLTEEGVRLVKAIAALGHECGLHYDCTGFEALTEGQRQRRIQVFANALEDATGLLVRTIAQHKPAKSPIRQEFPLYRDAYNDAYFKDIPYISDSRRSFFYHTDVLSFIKQHEKCQLLTHPIWWNERPVEISDIFAQLKDAINAEVSAQLTGEEHSINAFFERNKKQS
jgi:hypothetical protein